MPKKKDKKSGDKQNEDKKTAKRESSGVPADKNVSDDKEKDLYLIQIRYLNEQLERYQLKCDQLERQHKDLTSQYSSLEKEKKDVVEFLKRSLLVKEDEVDELTESLESQRRAADEDGDALRLQHDQLRRELQDRIQELTAENTTLAERLSGLDEFQRQKEKLVSNMESLEKQLKNQEEEHKAAIHGLEMKALLEKRSLEKEMESNVAAMTAEVQHLVDQKVPETTRRALQENAEVKARLERLSEQTQVLMEENAALRGRNTQLRVDVDILEETLRATSRKSCVRKKVVKQLTEKCEQLQAELKDRSHELEQLQAEDAGVKAEMETLRRGRASLTEQCSKHGARVSRLEEELQEERRRRSRMKSTMQDAAVTLRQALMEAPAELDSDSVVRWKQLMQKLLVVLDGPSLTNCSTENEQETDAAAARSQTLNPALSFRLELARYRPGDLGLVPRPKPKHVIAHAPLHRKPSSNKTTSSMNVTDSGVGSVTSRNSFTKRK